MALIDHMLSVTEVTRPFQKVLTCLTLPSLRVSSTKRIYSKLKQTIKRSKRKMQRNKLQKKVATNKNSGHSKNPKCQL